MADRDDDICMYVRSPVLSATIKKNFEYETINVQ